MNLLVYGSGIFGRLVRDNLIMSGHHFAGYIDDYRKGDDIVGGYDIFRAGYPAEEYGVVIGIGYKHFEERQGIFNKLKESGYSMPAIIHPASYVADPDTVHDGAIIMAGAIVDIKATIGELTVLWPGACVNHDTTIGCNCFISPNATVCGSVSIGDSVFLGAGATVADHVEIGDNVFIKAGEVVGMESIQRTRRDIA